MKNIVIILKALTTNVDTIYELTKKHSMEIDALSARIAKLEQSLIDDGR